MASLSYRYVKEDGIYRPKIPIIISVDGVKTEVVGLIDSGSDFVLFPREIAEAVGIKLSRKIDKADGIGGQIRCRSGLATIILKKGNIIKRLTNMKIYVQIDENGIDEILLGRTPFFNILRLNLTKMPEG